MAKPAAPEAAKSLIKREPILILSGIVTMVSTALYVAPKAFGIPIPDKAAKVISLVMMLAAGVGGRSFVKPA